MQGKSASHLLFQAHEPSGFADCDERRDVVLSTLDDPALDRLVSEIRNSPLTIERRCSLIRDSLCSWRSIEPEERDRYPKFILLQMALDSIKSTALGNSLGRCLRQSEELS